MKPVKDFPYQCERCRFWRFSRTDNARVCVNPESSYYGEVMDGNTCCLNFVVKKEEKK